MDEPGRPTVAIELDKALVDRAESAGVDVRRLAEEALRRGVREARGAQMSAAERENLLREINREIDWFNDHVDRHGLFSDHWRRF